MLQTGHALTPESAAEAAAPAVWLLQNGGTPLPPPQLAMAQPEPDGPNPFQTSPGGDMPGAANGRGPSLQHRPPLPPASHPRQAGMQPSPGERDSGYGDFSPEMGRRLSDASSSDTQEELVGASDPDSSDAHQWASQAASRASLHMHDSEPELHSRGHLSVSSGGPQVCPHRLCGGVSAGWGHSTHVTCSTVAFERTCALTGLHARSKQACR